MQRIFLFLSLFFLLAFAPLARAEGTGYEIKDAQVFFDGALLDFADPSTFVVLNGDFAQDKNFCVYHAQKLQSCQVKSFTYSESDAYSKDGFSAYFGGTKIGNADAQTFSWVGEGYAKDRSKVYYNGQAVREAASDSFKVLEFGYAKDKNFLFKGGLAIKAIDSATVSIINSEYIKDKTHVYFLEGAIEDADPVTFQLMADGYASDKSYFFHNGKAAAKLTNKFYYRFQKKDLSGTCFKAEVETATGSFDKIDDLFSKDASCVYYLGEAIQNSQPSTFVSINARLFKDRNFVYYISDTGLLPIPFADALSFQDLGGGYYKDSYAIYYGKDYQVINGAETAGFKVTCLGKNCNYEAEDGNRFYANGMEVALDAKTQQIIGEAKLVYLSSADPASLAGYNGVARNQSGESVAKGKFLKDLLVGIYGSKETDKQNVVNFIFYGTQMTRGLGEGERAGVVNSYKTAFGKLPASDQEWSDLIKIATGRWPTERNEVAEERAERRFRYIYKRAPLSIDEHDNAAKTIIAYGLSPAKRIPESEKSAIRTFKKLFLEYPSSASDWDMVRAVAYSGARR
jgi:hypothetical protein